MSPLPPPSPIHFVRVDQPSTVAIDASSPQAIPTLVARFGRPAAMVLHYLGCRLQHGGGHVTDVGTLATVLGLATGDVVGALDRLRIEGMVWPCDNGLAVRLDAGAAVGAMPKTPMSGPEGPLTSFGG